MKSFDLDYFIDKIKHFDTACMLCNNNYSNGLYHSFELMAGYGVKDQLIINDVFNGFDALQQFIDAHKNEWIFGFLSYDLKNGIESLQSNNFDSFELPVIHFFVPEEIHTIPKGTFFSLKKPTQSFAKNDIDLKPRITKSAYINVLESILKNIYEGDIYEMNFCQEFYAENVQINATDFFKHLNYEMKSPFAALFKLQNNWLLSQSPERYLKKEGEKLISQPIKGTIARGSDPMQDAQLREKLFHSEKDRAEHIMIVDLVRNDLVKCCQIGTVEVEELFGIYPFEQVFQMISTITGNVRENISFIDILKNTFPMGSMTGAPKIKSMELIEKYETVKRGLYSGAIGYITPNGDFDFNVVIRSIFYNELASKLSCQVGGAIVYDSNPEEEYNECLLKISAIRNLLNKKASE